MFRFGSLTLFHAVMSVPVMSMLLSFSVPAWVPQNPGVRQISSPGWHSAGRGSIGSQTPVASVHTVQMGSAQITSGPESQRPVAGTQASGPLQTLPSSLQVSVLCVWCHVPAPSQPAVVQALPSVSPQVVLSAKSVSSQSPFAGLQAGIPLQTLLSSVQTAVTCPGSHVPAPSQPAVVQALPSVSPQVVLSAASGPSLHASMASSQNSGPSQTLPSEGQSTGVPGLHPLWRSADAVNWALLGVVEQPPAPPLQVSTTVTVAGSPSGSGSAGWIV